MNQLFFLRALNITINIYIFLLFIRILCSWFRPSVDGKLWHYLCLITGPYLALFKSIKILRRGIFDFTPVLAIALLGFCNQIFQHLIAHFEAGLPFTLGVPLAYVIVSLWDIISFIIMFFGILCIIRLVSIFLRVNQSHNVLKIIDLAIQPLVSIVMKIIPKKMDYVQLLFLNFLFLIMIWLGGRLIFDFLTTLFLSLPA
jgi:uncharacterized protein YggT (Ycf19 family)